MLSGLILTAFLMGLTGAPHCATMCGVPCAAAFRQGIPLSALLGRWLGYALLGGIAATGAAAVSQWGREVAILKPIWLMAQSMAVLFGVWLLFTGRMPGQLDQAGLRLYHSLRKRWGQSAEGSPAPWGSHAAPLLAGMAWAAMPCGLLYGALMVAALAPSALGGALVMSAFAIPSGLAVWAAPKLIHRVSSGLLRDPQWAIRMAGLMLAVMAGWGLAQHLWAQWQAWCG
ncbi:MAG: sulfite exporter TauE/SafE family protein [Acidobacteriota bacterium]